MIIEFKYGPFKYLVIGDNVYREYGDYYKQEDFKIKDYSKMSFANKFYNVYLKAKKKAEFNQDLKELLK